MKQLHPDRLEQHPAVVGAVAVEGQVVLGRVVVDRVVHEEVGRLAPRDDLARVRVDRLDDALAPADGVPWTRRVGPKVNK